MDRFIIIIAVEEVLPLVGGYGRVAMKDGVRLEVSRRRMNALLEALQGTPHREL